MRLLLTGGSGFVGRSFIKLAGEGHEIVSLGRTAPTETYANVEFITVDITNKESLARVANANGEFDALVHMAAYVPRLQQEDDLQSSHDVNIQGTINLLEIFNGKVKKIIVGSTAEVYDQSKIEHTIDENASVGPVSYYGATKLGSEFIASAFGKKNKIPVIILRFSVMYGPDDPISRALPNFIKKALANEPIEVVEGTLRDYIHIDDVALSIHKAVLSKKSLNGVYNIGTGKGVSIANAAKLIIDSSNSSSEVFIKKNQKGVDIVIDTLNAERELGFTAQYVYPDKITEMIDSYR